MNEMAPEFAAGMVLHAIACLLIFMAVASAVIWLARFATKAEVKRTFWATLVVGVLACILSCVLAGPTMMKGWDRDDGREDMEDRMDEMMDRGDDETTEEVTDAEPVETPAQ